MRYALVMALVLPLGVVGCGGGRIPAQGKATANGQPVTGGTLIFTPLGGSGNDKAPGKPASAEIKSDGTFSLGTERAGDGAAAGRYRVIFTPPQQELTEQQRTDGKYKAPPPKYMGMVPKQEEVEVKAGTTIEIELVNRK